ncbi:LysR family transcriptional regulator [Algirhabdus cladophorae]|uniref:LysR family transcriptional regulator n=1 Tax=Algirhabdus cladophorae TaxID=3377108 RepID=UPI003B846E9B
MNLSEIQTFLAIIETGSLVRASERLNVTQSTVTARLKSLEAELGQTLIIRNKSGAATTASGQRLKRYAETMLDLWQQARRDTGLPDGVSGVFNIGCHPDLWQGMGKAIFSSLHKAHPELALSIWHGTGAELQRWQADGRIDMAIGYRGATSEGQVLFDLGADTRVCVSTEADSPIRFNPGYVYVEAGEDFGRWHAATYADAGTAKLSFGTAALGLAHVLQSGGSAYLPHRMVARHLQRGRLFHLSDAPPYLRKAFAVVNQAALGDIDISLHLPPAES